MTKFTTLLAAAAVLVVSAPALAQSPTTLCEIAPQQIRDAAASATDAKKARKALFSASQGEKLCQAEEKNEARKKFKVAYNALGLDFAAALAKTGAQAN